MGRVAHIFSHYVLEAPMRASPMLSGTLFPGAEEKKHSGQTTVVSCKGDR